MMSEITVKCLRCGKRHGLAMYNTKVLGPVIEVWCPFCKKNIQKNLTKFAEQQINTYGLGRFEKFEVIRTLSREIIKELE